jgi:hypothetical protein
MTTASLLVRHSTNDKPLMKSMQDLDLAQHGMITATLQASISWMEIL